MSEIRAGLPPGTEIELWWQDEARVGQKNKITRRWARRGTRPSAPQDQRTRWAYMFGAICPKTGKGAGLVMPWADTHAMNLHLAEISQAVDPGAHAVVILDQAGWHTSRHLIVPDNITLLPLPPRSPELNPVENVWQFMRDNWLSNASRLIMTSGHLAFSTTLTDVTETREGRDDVRADREGQRQPPSRLPASDLQTNGDAAQRR